MLYNLRRNISRVTSNLNGWKSSRKIIVIESDDWGSIRMPNRETFDFFIEKGYKLEMRPFERYDTLATSSDLNSLFDMLRSISNIEGKHPIITANTVVANPDFDKIAASNFTNYFYEPFTTTLERYYPNDRTFETWKSGIDQKLFYPQFHAREHYNVHDWLKLLQEKESNTTLAFSKNMVGIPSNSQIGNRLLIAFGAQSKAEIEQHKIILQEGLALFEQIFGFKSKSFIAPVYTWSEQLNETLAQQGVQFLQGGKFQLSPNVTTKKTDKIKHTLGQKNKLAQHYLTRNIFFEPSTSISRDWVTSAVKDVEASFFFKRPAIISAHRLNFVGFLDPNNAERGRTLLHDLLAQVVKKHPNVEFLTSNELGELIASN